MSEITRAFVEGGWGMIPTALLGTLALALALRHALSPKRELVPLIVGLGTGSLLAGMLGFVTGLIATARYIGVDAPENPIPLAIAGTGESLHNVAAALMLTTLASIAATIGAYRMVRPDPARIDRR